jgi:outer membrane immunogenic protein
MPRIGGGSDVVRKCLLAAAVLMALGSPAIGADLLPDYGAATPVAPAWSFTGCYVGGNVGGLWAESEKWIVRTPGGDFYGQSLGGHDLDDWIGGVQAGCDYQFTGGVVLGVAGDYGWTDAKGSHASAREFGVFYHSDIESLASVTGRVGYAYDRLLGYIKVGGAWESVDYSASTILIGTAYRASETRSGWTIGAGGAYAFTAHLSGFVEYGYYDFGTDRVRLTPQRTGLSTGFLDIEETSQVVRAGLNLRFGG